MSLKSTIFFSFLLFLKAISKSIIKFCNFTSISYILIKSVFASSDFDVKILSLLFVKSFFILSLISLALSFSGFVIFLVLGHFKNSTLFAKVYALSQVSKFSIKISSCCKSDVKILSYVSSSLSTESLCFSACNFFISSSSSSFI